MSMEDIYTREAIEKGYHKLTDEQWEILKSEMEEADDNLEAIVYDVIMNMDSYEQEYASWNK